jgi:hypothetical protein
MPINYKNYPANWKAFSLYIRFDRAQGRCECTGECGESHAGRCTAMHGQLFYPRLSGRRRVNLELAMIVLTVAHLWQHSCKCTIKCAIDSHVKAMCQACHLAYDVEERAGHARATRQTKKDAQRNLLRLM